MKKIISLLILCSFWGLANINYSFASTPVQVAEEKIAHARLMEQSIKRLIVRIGTLEQEYPEIEKEYIENTLIQLVWVLKELENIQTGMYTFSRSQDILQNTLSFMKILNRDIQNRIQKIQENRQESITRAYRSYDPVIREINKFTQQLLEIYSSYYLSLQVLDRSDREAINILVEIREINMKLSNYRENNFQQLSDLQNYLRITIQSLRYNIAELRRIRSS
jgi:hypothetical protein